MQLSKTTIPFLLITALLFSCGTPKAPEEATAPAEEKIVPADAKLEHLFTRTADIKGGLTEGPAVAADGSIYFSDIAFGKDKGMILRFDPKTGETTVFAEDSHKSNGLAFDAEGHLIAAEGSNYGGRRISRWNVETSKRTTLADNYKGKKFNAPNDLAVDSQGRVYFSDPRYLGPETRDLDYFAIFRVDKDGTVIEITREVAKPNGVTLSPDEKTLYAADHDNGSEHVEDPNRNFHFELPLHPKSYASYPVVSTANSSGLFEVIVRHILAVLRSRCAGFACPACLAADTYPARPLLST